MKPDGLLKILDPEPDDPLLAASLARTLNALREQRRRRHVVRGVGLFALVMVGFVLFQGRRWKERSGAQFPVAGAGPVKGTLEMISSGALAPGMWVQTQPNLYGKVETQLDGSIELLNDDELLNLAPGCLALTRIGGQAGVILLCEEMLGLP